MEKPSNTHDERPRPSGRPRWPAFVATASLAALAACTPGMADKLFGDPRFILGLTSLQSYYTEPGVDRFTQLDKKIDLKLVELIEEAEKSVDVAVYNLSRDSIIEALTLAEERGIKVRMVGDVDEVVTDGYRKILRTPIPFSLGNTTAIQHNKFAVVDKKHLFMGTGNITTSGFIQNNENFLIMESESMARDFTNEFEQMYFGKYGSKKAPLTSNFHHRIDFTNLELYFSPYNGQEAMDRIIELVNNARTSVKYMIFAHTHDELSTAKIRAAKRGVLVRGIHDSTFVNGTSEEAPRFWGAAQHMPNLQVRRDGNENTATIGLASHGGKLHCKSIIIDDEVICTGSFNWSNNAVENNDENMVCVFNPIIAQTLARQWQGIWDVSQPVTNLLRHPSGDTAQPGEVVISEVMWAGSYDGSKSPTFLDNTDDWIELYNTSDRDIDISHWSITWDGNESVFYPIPDEYNWFKDGVASRHYFTGRLIIPAKGHFLLKGQNQSINNSDNKVSGVKNFALSSSGFQVRLYDVTMTLIDQAGNGDPPAAGRIDNTQLLVFSMERFFYPSNHAQAGKALPGAAAGSWYTSNGNGGNVLGNSCAAFGPCGEYQLLEEFITNTIGTPRYSGNGSVASPTSVQSTAFGGIGLAQYSVRNVPIRAHSTSSTSAVVQMRWALVETPTVNSNVTCAVFAGNNCPASLDPSDPSKILVTTGTQTAGGQNPLIIVGLSTGGFGVTGNTKDVAGPTSDIAGGRIDFEGHGNGRADVRITTVAPAVAGSEDVIILQAVTSGTVQDLGIYYFEPGFGVFPPILLYRMADVPITVGQTIRLTLDRPTTVSDDQRCLGGCFNVGDGASYDIAQNTAGVWDVFSSQPGIQSTDGVIFLAYGVNETPIDGMCYSNRDGDALEGLMKGGFRQMYNWPASVYPMTVFAVDNNNDFLVQSQCADYSRGGTSSSANNLFRQNVNATGPSAWSCKTTIGGGTDC